MRLADYSSGFKYSHFGKNKDFEPSKLHCMDSKQQAAKIREQLKEIKEIAEKNESLYETAEKQKKAIEFYEQVNEAQKETIMLQRRQLDLQRDVFKRVFAYMQGLEQEMQATLQAVMPTP
jgi:ribonuclease HII